MIIGQTLEIFLCSLLSQPLPSYPSAQLIEFMSMQRIVGTKDLGSVIDNDEPFATDNSHSFDCDKEFSNIAVLVESCKVAISQAERQSVLAGRLSRDILQIINAPQPVTQATNYVQSPQSQNDEAFHDALMTVMAERDGAQSQLLAERVFHAHELDQERRKVDILEKKIEVVKRLHNEDSASAAAFFLGTEEVPSKNSLGKIEKEMVQNVDAELMELCRQLSTEISTRVSTELEILRLKESRRIELETEKRQLDALNEELQMYKQKASDVLNERDHLKREAEKWKQCFETAISHQDNKDDDVVQAPSP